MSAALGEFVSRPRFPLDAPPIHDEAWPRISIVTPSYNQGAFLERTILSIHNQGYPNLEHIVMDGGSTDGSVQVLRRYDAVLAHWQSGRDSGQSGAINAGAARATGQVMTWINSDDMLLPGALEAVGRALMQDPSLDLVYGNQVEVDEADRVTKRVFTIDFDRDGFLFEINIIFPQQSTFWRVDLFREVGGLLPLRYAMDYDLFYRFVKRGVRWLRLPDFLSAFRVYPGSLTGSGTVRGGRGPEVDAVFRDALVRERTLADRTVRRWYHKARRFAIEPRALAAAVEHRLGQAANLLRCR